MRSLDSSCAPTRPTVMTVLPDTLLHLVREPDTTPEEVVFLEKMPLNLDRQGRSRRSEENGRRR
jgi:hypothetical protein